MSAIFLGNQAIFNSSANSRGSMNRQSVLNHYYCSLNPASVSTPIRRFCKPLKKVFFFLLSDV